MADVNWLCPHCQHAVTISDSRRSADTHTLRILNSDGFCGLVSIFVVCPNPTCGKFSLHVSLVDAVEDRFGNVEAKVNKVLRTWNLIPGSIGKVFPDYIPRAIREDYLEACEIRDLSPKASATLSRRCLQGMIRDFWGVKPGRLVDEIEAIKDKIDPLDWEAIDSVRQIGNIGAHMEKDIDVIVDVDPGEARLLTGLIETLLEEWYVVRETRRVKMEAIKASANAKTSPTAESSPNTKGTQ